MNKRIVNQLAIVMTFLAVVTVFSSCNRGVGCPNNFSNNITVVDVAKTVSSVVFNK
jgi:hypothetical protein